MKKVVTLFLLLALVCVGTAAMAEYVPSKSTANMVTVGVKTEGAAANVAFTVTPSAKQAQTCQNEIAKLSAASSVEAYFGDVKTADGASVDMKALLGTSTLNVYEFMPVAVQNYETTYGKVEATFNFSTPYAVNEKVIVLVGIPDANGKIVWTALEGVGVAGGVQVAFDEAILQAIQSGDAVMAVVSK